jgi:hypothetical protein
MEMGVMSLFSMVGGALAKGGFLLWMRAPGGAAGDAGTA